MRNATVYGVVTASAAGHRPQQPRRVGAHDRCDPASERRRVVAPARSRRRHRSSDARLARRARRRDRVAKRSTSAPAEQNYRIRELAEIVHERLPDCEVTFADDASPDPRSYRVDFSKFAARFPDCRFEWTAQRGADELVRAYESAGLTSDEFQGGRYTRLTRLKYLLERGCARRGSPLGRAATRRALDEAMMRRVQARSRPPGRLPPPHR